MRLIENEKRYMERIEPILRFSYRLIFSNIETRSINNWLLILNSFEGERD